MSAVPFRLPERPKEPPFDVTAARQIVVDLLVHPTDAVECDTIEVKDWCDSEKDFAEKVSEACACLANASGGFVFAGVSNKIREKRKFSHCPYPNVTARWILARIHDQTVPPVECSVRDLSDVACQESATAGVNLFAAWVPGTRHISGHITTKGVSKIRVGKECKVYYIAEDDRTHMTVPEISLDDLSSSSIEWGTVQHQKRFGNSTLWADNAEFLEQARLVERYLLDEDQVPQYRVSLAALLLFGTPRALECHVPFFETVVVTPTETIRIRKNVVDSIRELCSSDSSLLRSLLPQIPHKVLKEVIVNAFIHRCYRTPGPLVLQQSASGLEVQSPGELPNGVELSNLIYCVPIYRNLLLADGARFLGLCDKIGKGINDIYEGVLLRGLAFPEFESANSVFTARIHLGGSEEFREFLKRRAQALTQLDEVIVLRLLWAKLAASVTELRCKMQRKEEFAGRVLADMCRKLMIEQLPGQPASYQLTTTVRNDIQNIFRSDQMSLNLPAWSQ